VKSWVGNVLRLVFDRLLLTSWGGYAGQHVQNEKQSINNRVVMQFFEKKQNKKTKKKKKQKTKKTKKKKKKKKKTKKNTKKKTKKKNHNNTETMISKKWKKLENNFCDTATNLALRSCCFLIQINIQEKEKKHRNYWFQAANFSRAPFFCGSSNSSCRAVLAASF
jgi:hypothetical protein